MGTSIPVKIDRSPKELLGLLDTRHRIGVLLPGHGPRVAVEKSHRPHIRMPNPQMILLLGRLSGIKQHDGIIEPCPVVIERIHEEYRLGRGRPQVAHLDVEMAITTRSSIKVKAHGRGCDGSSGRDEFMV